MQPWENTVFAVFFVCFFYQNTFFFFTSDTFLSSLKVKAKSGRMCRKLLKGWRPVFVWHPSINSWRKTPVLHRLAWISPALHASACPPNECFASILADLWPYELTSKNLRVRPEEEVEAGPLAKLFSWGQDKSCCLFWKHFTSLKLTQQKKIRWKAAKSQRWPHDMWG